VGGVNALTAASAAGEHAFGVYATAGTPSVHPLTGIALQYHREKRPVPDWP